MEKPERKKNRLTGFDYSSCGMYFVTICSKDRISCFWTGVGANCVRPDAAIPLSSVGEIVCSEIGRLSDTYAEMTVEKFCIMPNHVHLLILIHPDEDGRTQFAPTLSRAIKQFKGAVSKRAGYPVWQKSFYDHVVRDRESYLDIWRYIDENPLKWQMDSLCNGRSICQE